MRPLRIGCIVEGDGEVEALPVLLRRIVREVRPGTAVDFGRPFRIPVGSMKTGDGLERAINRLALDKISDILVLVDADDDCPMKLAVGLAERARECRADLRVSVVVANKEYEAWFLAAAESIAGQRGLPVNLAPPPDAEAIRDAKRWLTQKLPGSDKYSPTIDQQPLSQVFDLKLAHKRSRSFRNCGPRSGRSSTPSRQPIMKAP